MPTTIETVIDTGLAGDYPSHNAAAADNYGASSANFVAVDETVLCRARATTGAKDTTGVLISGLTVDATHYPKIFTDTADTGGDGTGGCFRHRGKLPAVGAKIYVHQLAGTPVTTTVQYCDFQGLTFVNLTVAGDYEKGLYVAAAGVSNVEFCLFVSQADQTGHYGPFGLVIEMTNGGCHVAGNIFINYTLGTNASAMWIVGYAPATHRLYANTCVDGNRGIWRNDTAGTCIAKNNVCFGNTDDYAGSPLSAGSVNNAYSEGTDPGTDGLDLSGYTGAQVFLDYAGDDFHKLDSGPLTDAGVDLSQEPAHPTGHPVTRDFETDPRPSGTGFSIGADETAPPPPNPLNVYRVDITEAEAWMQECLRPPRRRRRRR